MDKLILLAKKGADEIAQIKKAEIELGNLVFHSNVTINEKSSRIRALLKSQLNLVADIVKGEYHITQFLGKLAFASANRTNKVLFDTTIALQNEIKQRNTLLFAMDFATEQDLFIKLFIGENGRDQTSAVHKFCDIICEQYVGEEDVVRKIILSLNTWPKRVIVIRHGLSAQNAALKIKKSDPVKYASLYTYGDLRDDEIPLAEEGFFQATETGKLLKKMFTDKGVTISMCYSSPYKRTQDTLRGILSTLGQQPPIELRDELREKEFGVEHGLTEHEFALLHPADAELKKREGKFLYRPHGGESYRDVRDRVKGFLSTLKRKNSGQTVIVVTHQVTYKCFRSLIDHDTVNDIASYPETPNCGVAVYEVDLSLDPPSLERVRDQYDLKAY